MAENSEFITKNRQKKRISDILLKQRPIIDGYKSLYLNFLRSPIKFISDSNNNVQAINFTKNIIKDGKLINTNVNETIECGLVIKSIGYLNSPLLGVRFDSKLNLVPSIRGHIPNSNLFVSGWIKTGPIGVLTSTLFDANETAQTIQDNLHLLEGEKQGLQGLNLTKFTSLQDWLKINKEEINRGKLLMKPREKMKTTIEIKNLLNKS